MMKKLPTDDDCFGQGTIRADGRKIHPSYLFQVKPAAEVREPGAVYKLLATTPAGRSLPPDVGRRLPAGEGLTAAPLSARSPPAPGRACAGRSRRW